MIFQNDHRFLNDNEVKPAGTGLWTFNWDRSGQNLEKRIKLNFIIREFCTATLYSTTVWTLLNMCYLRLNRNPVLRI